MLRKIKQGKSTKIDRLMERTLFGYGGQGSPLLKDDFLARAGIKRRNKHCGHLVKDHLRQRK